MEYKIIADSMENSIWHIDMVMYMGSSEMSVDNSKEQEELLAQLRECPYSTICVDLTGIDYIDSTGISTLVIMFRDAWNMNRAIDFSLNVIKDGPIYPLIKVAKLDRAMKVMFVDRGS